MIRHIKMLICMFIVMMAAGMMFPNVAFKVYGNDTKLSDEYEVTESYSPGDSNDESSEDLFEQYIEQELKASIPAYDKRNLKSKRVRLSGANLASYNVLKTEISKVADGERTSTIFEVTLDDLGLDENGWTASELGLSALTEDGQLTDETTDALFDAIGFDLPTLINALLSDCPYDLYWYDKTAATSIGNLQFSLTGGTEEQISFASGFTFYFPVASGYSAGEYTVDTSNGERVQHAVEKAKAIVDEHKSEPDYTKLDSYRVSICDLVEYDHDAAGNENTSYGDPWQIISVFDEDSSTNVVCEGYSKAFKYLCDLTSFENEQIHSISVSGTMSGGTGAGAHMWNIVTMDDGNNYLVDITNCDTGTIGADNQL